MQIVLPAIGVQQPIYQYLFAQPITLIVGPYVASLSYAVAFVIVWWLIVYAMDRRRWYLKL